MCLWVGREKDALLVAIDGDFDLAAAQALRRMTAETLARERVRKIVFDFSRVRFLDSSGLGAILGRQREMAERGGEVVLIHVGEPARGILRMAGFGQLLRIEEEGGN